LLCRPPAGRAGPSLGGLTAPRCYREQRYGVGRP